MSTGDVKEFARRELEGFFRRREERGKVYCAGCLVEQLRQRGAQGVRLPGRPPSRLLHSAKAVAIEARRPLYGLPSAPFLYRGLPAIDPGAQEVIPGPQMDGSVRLIRY